MKQCEQLWAREKYRVMFYSQRHYNMIRRMMRDGCTIDALTKTINEALQQTPTVGSQLNAIQHMWGYFKKYATSDEKKTYQSLVETRQIDPLLHHLQLLAHRYNVLYLQQSTVLNYLKNGNSTEKR